MFFYVIFQLLLVIAFSQAPNNCLGPDNIQSTCRFCGWGYYDEYNLQKQLSNWTSPLTINFSDCKERKINLIRTRKVLITNSALKSSFLSNFDANYPDFIQGLLYETNYLLQNNVTEEYIFLVSGTHYHFQY